MFLTFWTGYLYSEETAEPNPNYINYKNGLYDLAHRQFIPHTPEIFTVNQLAVNHNPNIAQNSYVDNFITSITTNHELREKALWEISGYCQTSRTDLQCAFIFIGNGGNGKSAFAKMLYATIGSSNVTEINIQDFSERFSAHNMEQKLLNLVPDLPASTVKDVSTFKALVTGDQITADVRYTGRIDLKSYAKHIFTANKLPFVKDTSNGFYRRIYILQFDANFTDEQKLAFDVNDLLTTEALEYFAYKSLCEYVEFLDSKTLKLANYEESEKLLEHYKEQSNSILNFLKCEENSSLYNHDIKTTEMYNFYILFCKENKFQALGKIEFYKLLQEEYGFVKKKVNGLDYFYKTI